MLQEIEAEVDRTAVDGRRPGTELEETDIDALNSLESGPGRFIRNEAVEDQRSARLPVDADPIVGNPGRRKGDDGTGAGQRLGDRLGNLDAWWHTGEPADAVDNLGLAPLQARQLFHQKLAAFGKTIGCA